MWHASAHLEVGLLYTLVSHSCHKSGPQTAIRIVSLPVCSVSSKQVICCYTWHLGQVPLKYILKPILITRFWVSHLLSCLKVAHLCVSSWKIPLLNSRHHIPPWPHWFQRWLHFWRTFSIPEETLNCHVIIFFATAFLKYLDSSPMWNFTHFPRFSSNIASSLKSLHSTLTHPYCIRHWKSYNRVLVCMSSIDHKTLWGRHNKWLIFFFPKCLESNKWSASVCWNNTLLFLILSFFLSAMSSLSALF